MAAPTGKAYQGVDTSSPQGLEQGVKGRNSVDVVEVHGEEAGSHLGRVASIACYQVSQGPVPDVDVVGVNLDTARVKGDSFGYR